MKFQQDKTLILHRSYSRASAQVLVSLIRPLVAIIIILLRDLPSNVDFQLGKTNTSWSRASKSLASSDHPDNHQMIYMKSGGWIKKLH